MAALEQRIDTATVLFTDVVDSTALRTRLGEEAADALRVRHDELMNDAITAARGLVVKHTGDGVMATFSAAVDAVSAAIAIQQSVDAHNRRSDQERFDVRVGISVGDVTFEGDDCFGLPVIEAQRLEAAATGGQIYCAEIVRHLARGRGGFEFVTLGELELKGLPDPVPAVEVKWTPVVHVAMARETPLPPVLAAPSAFDLAGRSAELEVLVDAWKESAESHSRVVLLSGEPGIGKTRLAREAAEVARRGGGLVLAGRCDEEMGLPYQPFVEALRFQMSLGDDAPPEWFGAHAGELTRLAPEFPNHVPGVADPLRGDPETERARLFEGVTSWLRSTAASVPVMLVLDDIHWADKPTLLLLRHLLQATTRDALFIVGTYRSTDLDRTHPLSAMLADLRRDPHVTRLSIDGLSADGVAEFMERAAGHELAPEGVELANALYAETAGNPFFVGEVIRHLVESGALVFREGRWTSDFTLADVGLPEGVREVVGRRISRLDEASQRLLSVAAVIGHEFALPVLSTVAGADEDAVLDLLDTAQSAGLVNEVGLDRYRFSHALVRATLLEEQTTSRRVRTHRKIGETLEAQHGSNLTAVVTDLAYHFGEAAATDPERAVRYALLAGDAAYEGSAADDAARWYELALEHLDIEDREIATEVDVLTRLARAEWAAGISRPDERVMAAARLARDAGLYGAMAEALMITTRTSFDVGQESNPERVALMEDALAHLDDPALRARLMGALAIELVFVGDDIRRGPLLDEAIALARDSGDELAIIDTAIAYFNACPRTGWTGERFRADVAVFEQAARIADARGDAVRRMVMHSHMAFASMALHDGERLRAEAATLRDEAATGRNPTAVRVSLLVEQMIAMLEGRLVEAEALSMEQYAVWVETIRAEAITYRAVEEFCLRREQGRLDSIVAPWQAYIDIQPLERAGRAVVAFARAATGHLDDAAARLDEVSGDNFADVPDEAGWPLAIAMFAEVAALVEDRAAAAALEHLLRPLDGLMVGTGGFSGGPSSRLLARLELVRGETDSADAHFAQAIGEAQAIGSAVWVARSQLDWAETWITRDPARAAQLADDAEAAIGALPLVVLREQLASVRDRVIAR